MPLQCGSTTWFHGTASVRVPVHGGGGGEASLIEHGRKVAEVRIRQMVSAFVRQLRCPSQCNPPRSLPGDVVIQDPQIVKSPTELTLVVAYRFPVSCPPPEPGTAAEPVEEVPASWPFADPMPVEESTGQPNEETGLPGTGIPADAERVCRSHPADSCQRRRDYTAEFRSLLRVVRVLGPAGRVIGTLLGELADAGVLRVVFEVRQEWRADWRHVCPPRLTQSFIDEYVRQKTDLAQTTCRAEAAVPRCVQVHRNFYAALEIVAAEAAHVIVAAVEGIWTEFERQLLDDENATGPDPVADFSALDRAWSELKRQFDDVHELHQWEWIAGGAPAPNTRPLLRRYYVQQLNEKIGVGPLFYLERAFIGNQRDLDIFDIGDLKGHLRQYVATKVKSRVRKAILDRIKGLVPGQ